MIMRHRLPILEVSLMLVLVLGVKRTLQATSGGFIPTLNVTADQWSGENGGGCVGGFVHNALSALQSHPPSSSVIVFDVFE